MINSCDCEHAQCKFNLPTPDGWKAELTYGTGYTLRQFTRTQTVTHPSTNLEAYDQS